MRRALWALYLHALLIPQHTIVLLMSIYVVAVVIGWCLLGIVIAMWVLPPPVLRSIP
jgi:hypothetical protein